MDIAPMSVHGWNFELSDSGLLITSEEDAQARLHLGAQAAFSLLDYLYQHRDDLHDASQRERDEAVEQQKAERRAAEARDEVLSE